MKLKKPKQKKRYASAFEIELEMAVVHKKLMRNKKIEESLEDSIRKLAIYSNDVPLAPKQIGELGHMKERLARSIKHSKMLEETKLPKLKRTHAVFKTKTMAFLEDASVTMQD